VHSIKERKEMGRVLERRQMKIRKGVLRNVTDKRGKRKERLTHGETKHTEKSERKVSLYLKNG